MRKDYNVKGRISHNACTNDLNTFCRQRISQGPQNHSRLRTHTLEIHTRTLSLRSKVTTHTTPQPDTILEGQRNNGAFRQRSVTVNKGDLVAPEGPGDTELSQIFHSTQEARVDATTGEMSATRRLGNARWRSIHLGLSRKSRMRLSLSERN